MKKIMQLTGMVAVILALFLVGCNGATDTATTTTTASDTTAVVTPDTTIVPVDTTIVQ